MAKYVLLVILALLLLGAPLVLQRPSATSATGSGDPTLVVVTPMTEAIRHEFGLAFSAWHSRRYGRPVRMDWRNVGGSSEISRYLGAEYVNACRAWWRLRRGPWPAGAGDILLRPAPDPAWPAGWRTVYDTFRHTDDPAAFSAGMDLLWGGGEYDHRQAHLQGLTVEPWPADAPPAGLWTNSAGELLIPEGLAGERWRTPYFFGCVVSAFGICCNLDRLQELGLGGPLGRWEELADPKLYGQVAVADPTKSGSMAKAFEMIVQQQCAEAVRTAGFTDAQTEAFEASYATGGGAPGERPPGVPTAYDAAVARGWDNGLRLLQRIGANARYFTDAASKVAIDVSQGDAAAGLIIDFYARYQAQYSRDADGRARMMYVTPPGGSSVSADPVSLLRGAPHRETALRFIEFLLGEDGQRLWAYRPGAPGGPVRYALCRLPIRRDFYPSAAPSLRKAWRRHQAFTQEPLDDPAINPYALARTFTYRPRWTARHFNVLRDLVRCMCMDSATELKRAWRAILDHGGPARQPAAMALLGRLPDRPRPLTWTSAPLIAGEQNRLDCMRMWTDFFRHSYREAEGAVTPPGDDAP